MLDMNASRESPIDPRNQSCDGYAIENSDVSSIEMTHFFAEQPDGDV
jgi:hypothetical protein